jgi:hypothetical protein
MSRLTLPCAIGLAATLLLVAACQPRPATTPEPVAPAPAQPWPPYDYAAAADTGMLVFVLDPERTQIDVVVRRDGPLARFGHDHVINVRDPEGYLLLAGSEDGSRADLRFAVDRLQIDAADARQRHGLGAGPDAADVAGTRENLMRYVLDPVRWPWVTVSLGAFSRQADHWSADMVMGVNGRQFTNRQPFQLRLEQDVVTVEGFMLLRQTDLGLQPFSALGGGLRVADALEIHFSLSAPISD